MDYCHACRRHLNGALACAGCGTPVEELRYETPHIPVQPVQSYAPAYGAVPRRPEPAAEAEAEAGPGREPAPAPEHVYELDVLEPPRPPAGGRRAARGRSAARKGRRGRSRRGRTVLVGTLGLVMAAGALSLARLAVEDTDAPGAA
ncbi:SCO2400 family protein, partial [Streptomyces venezuelae]